MFPWVNVEIGLLACVAVVVAEFCPPQELNRSRIQDICKTERRHGDQKTFAYQPKKM